MSKSYNNSSPVKSLSTTQNLILAGVSWAFLALLYFLLFSAKIPDPVQRGIEVHAQWYVIGTNIFKAVAYLVASLLCWRNWRGTQMVSSGKVWLSIGLGMFAYFIGGLVFGYTEIVLKQDPDVSIADIFFVLTYLCLGNGMALALVSRRINLAARQWLIVAAVGALGSFLAWLISQKEKASTEQIAFLLNLFYIVSDVALLMIATTMLLAFWVGKVSLSWRMIAAAAFSLYIADMWFKFAQRPDYQSGDILEVFWVFSGVLFGLGAVLEYDASLSLKRRDRGRKRT
ncbi:MULTISPECIES: hypothetical protein [Nostocales]|jgi:hypothetical protein|uniref:Uncharacterized protein n=1 Tax=Dolichospermum flos-aquae UHCC 0037 TaxID=2590026 RepID=A0ACC7S079_DOLFA|nr:MULTISPECIES: hypothetical protein [Nostocales]ALB40532.1 hypothetical protein AA650_08655 [Anabaena sp. WA102]MBO1066352.1 hypothetical protein [Anabaena sp. 54]MBO1071187.1 hypothetical protein [Dolichospermum sp. DEX189]MTJ41823.1 hypothetical protein [Dolichospermum flos-aquae UHCC 0037]